MLYFHGPSFIMLYFLSIRGPQTIIMVKCDDCADIDVDGKRPNMGLRKLAEELTQTPLFLLPIYGVVFVSFFGGTTKGPSQVSGS